MAQINLTGQVVMRARDGVALEDAEIYTVVEADHITAGLTGAKEPHRQYVLLIPHRRPSTERKVSNTIIRIPADKFLDQMIRGFWKRTSTAPIRDDK